MKTIDSKTLEEKFANGEDVREYFDYTRPRHPNQDPNGVIPSEHRTPTTKPRYAKKTPSWWVKSLVSITFPQKQRH